MSDEDKAEVLAKSFTSVFTIEDDCNINSLGDIEFLILSSDEAFKPEEVIHCLKILAHENYQDQTKFTLLYF